MEEFVSAGFRVMEEPGGLPAGPAYVTFDIDCLDPSAPGNRTPGGRLQREAQHMIRL
jgi:arginase family enzyme